MFEKHRQWRMPSLWSSFTGKQRPLSRLVSCVIFSIKTVEGKTLLYKNNGCWSLEAQKSAMVYKRPALLNWNLLRIFSQGQHTEAVIQRAQVCISSWHKFDTMCKSPTRCWFGLHKNCRVEEVLESSWGVALGEAIGEAAASVVVKSLEQWRC